MRQKERRNMDGGDENKWHVIVSEKIFFLHLLPSCVCMNTYAYICVCYKYPPDCLFTSLLAGPCRYFF